MTNSGEFPHWTLSERLAKSLKHAGMTKAEMADHLRLSESTIANYLNDRTHVPYPVLLVWADRTGVDPDWLVGDAETHEVERRQRIRAERELVAV